MYIKKIFFLLFILLAKSGFSQTDPLFTQYMYNTLFLNPGSAGIGTQADSLAEIGNIARQQWVGIMGAPVSDVLWFQCPVTILNSGIGTNLLYDKAGPLTTYAFNFDFSIHLNVGNGKIGIGPGIGMTAINLDGSLLKSNDPDPILPKGNGYKINYNLDAGIWYKNPWIFTGISALHLLPDQSYNLSDKAGKDALFLIPDHYYIIAGFFIHFDNRIYMVPSLLVKQVASVMQNEASSMFYFNQKLNIGISYRQGESASFLLGYNFTKSNSFHINYAYDRIINDLRSVTHGSHEILITYRFPLLKEDEKEKQ